MGERGHQAGTTLRFLEFELDAASYRLSRKGEPLHVERRVFDLIAYLAKHRDRVVPRSELLAEVWGGVTVTSHVLVQALHAARRVLGENAESPSVLKTIRRAGVQFIAPAIEVPPLPSASFLGRDAELAAIRQALARAEAGLPQVVLVEGEPGAGKTRLCHEVLVPLEAAGASVHWGRCAESEGAPAFWPWIRAARTATSESPYPVAPQSEHRLAGDLGPSRFGMFDAITDWWRGTCESAPTIVVIDDLHRADDASFELFCFLAEEMRPCRFTLVATFRPGADDLDPHRRERLSELAGRSASTTLRLGGLPSEAVGEFCRAVQPGLSDLAVESIVQRSGGNPFFVTQLLTLSERDLGSGALPESVASSVRNRIEALPSTSRAVVSAASVLGREFDSDLAARMCGFDSEVRENAVAEAEATGLVARSGDVRARFVHDLVREAVYRGLSGSDRGRLHHEAAQMLLATGSDEVWSEVSYHASRAGAFGTSELTLQASHQAATQALVRFAFEDAIVHLSRYLEAATHAPDLSDVDRADHLLLLGRALLAVGDKQESRATLRQAARLGGWRYLAEAALETAPGIWSLEAGKFDLEAADLLRTALAAIPDDEHALRAMLGSRLAAALVWAPGSIAERRELVATARDHRSAATSRSARITSGLYDVLALWLPGECEERLGRIEGLLAEAQALQLPEAEVVLRVFRFTTLTELGRRTERKRELARLSDRLEVHPLPEALWYVPMLRASLATEECDWSAADEYRAEFARVGEALRDLNFGHAQAGFAMASAFHNDVCSDFIEFAAAVVDQFPDFSVFRGAWALMLAESGRYSDSRECYSPLMSELQAVPEDNLWLLTSALVGECVATIGDSENAGLLLEAMKPFADEQPVAGYGVLSWGSVSRVLGRLARVISRPALAVDLLSRAIEQEQHSGCTNWLGYSLVERAAAETSLAGEPTAGVVRDLARADEIADRFGIPRLKRAVRESGDRPRST
ncbi:MAG: AAA family ATPase [Myxococcota bacterium]|nr:AAA family ATPase [Myxococcota bacterium]